MNYEENIGNEIDHVESLPDVMDNESDGMVTIGCRPQLLGDITQLEGQFMLITIPGEFAGKRIIIDCDRPLVTFRTDKNDKYQEFNNDGDYMYTSNDLVKLQLSVKDANNE